MSKIDLVFNSRSFTNKVMQTLNSIPFEIELEAYFIYDFCERSKAEAPKVPVVLQGNSLYGRMGKRTMPLKL